MNEPVGTPTPDQPKRNTPLIIGVVVVVLLCCCIIVAGVAWQFGDQIMQQLNF